MSHATGANKNPIVCHIHSEAGGWGKREEQGGAGQKGSTWECNLRLVGLMCACGCGQMHWDTALWFAGRRHTGACEGLTARVTQV